MNNLIGRDAEVRTLRNALDAVVSGKGATFLIGGEAGIGKTRLAEECIGLAASLGFKILKGWCMQGSLVPNLPMREAFKGETIEQLFAGAMPPKMESVFLVNKGGVLLAKRERKTGSMDCDIFTGMLTAVTQFIKDSVSQMGIVPEGNVSSIRYGSSNIIAVHGRHSYLASVLTGTENEVLVEDMRDMLGEIETRHGSRIDDWKGEAMDFAEIEGMINGLFESEKYEGIDWAKDDPKAKQSSIFENVTLGLVRMAKARPLLLFLDDLQWADTSTLALLHYLSRNTRSARIFILGTYRSEDIALGAEGRPHRFVETMQTMNREMLFEKIELRNLDDDQVAQLVRVSLGELEDDAHLPKVLTKESEGNPLYVLELLNLLKEEGAFVEKDGRWSLTREIQSIGVPSRVHDVIVRRLSRLDKEQRMLMEPASVIGNVFSSDVLGLVSDVSKVRLLQALNEIECSHKLIISMPKDYRFSHVKIKDVLYEGISKELKKEYHRLVGDALLHLHDKSDDWVTEIGYQYYFAGDAEKGIPLLMRGSELAMERFANDETIKYCKYLLDLMEGGHWERDRMIVLERLGDVEEMIGDYDGALITYNQVLLSSNDVDVRARMVRKNGLLLTKKGNYDEAFSELKRGEMLVQGQELAELGRIRTVQGQVHENRGDYDTAISCYNEALTILEPFQDVKRDIADVFIHLGISYAFKGDYDGAIERYGKGLELFENAQDQRGISLSLNHIGVIFDEKGEYDRALDFYERSMKIRLKLGDQHGIAMSLNNIGIIHCEKGDDDNALKCYQKALKIVERLGDQNRIGVMLTNIGTVLRSKEEYDKALEYYQRSLSIHEALGTKRDIATVMNNIGNIYFEKGDIDRAIEFYNEGLALTGAIGYKYLLTGITFSLSEAFMRKGQYDVAEGKAIQAIELAKEMELKEKEGLAYKVLAMIAHKKGDSEKSTALFERAIAFFRKIGDELDLAETYYEYGSSLGDRGDATRRAEMLRNALVIFEKFNKQKKVEKIKKEMG